jgi:hypothetical protein
MSNISLSGAGEARRLNVLLAAGWLVVERAPCSRASRRGCDVADAMLGQVAALQDLADG